MKLPVQRSLSSISSKELLSVLQVFKNQQTDTPRNPVVSQLMQTVKMAGMKVMGSPCQKLTYRQQMLGLVSYYGAPALFVIINLSDLHDPKVCIFILFIYIYELL